MAGEVQVLLYVAAPRTGGEEAVTAAYHQVSGKLAGTPGLVANRLLRAPSRDEGPVRFVVQSEWTDLAAFWSWEQGPEHRDATAPLRPFQETPPARTFGLYEVVAAYRDR